jgi:superfamily II DNA or RNA helicase
MVTVEQVNNVWAKVHCEPSVAQELSDFFTYSVPTAKFSPAYKSRHWDGKIRLFSIRTKQIYAGLIEYVREFCKISGYECTVMKHVSDLQDQIKIGIPKNLKHEPRDYQLAALEYALKKGRGVIVSPTASGKSLIIYLIVRNLMSAGKKQGLLIVPTTSLVEQMYADFKDYGWDVEKNCQRVYYDSGQGREPVAPLVISTWQSIFMMPKKYFAQFDYVIGDEAHQFKADSLKKIMTNLINCDYRIGTTGTLNSEKVHKLVLEGLFGPAKKFISTKELIDRGQLASFNVECLVLRYAEEECKKLRGAEYKDEIEFLVSNEARNYFLRNLAIRLDGNTLILYTYVDKHGKVLYDLFRDTINAERKVFFVCGKTDVEDREQVRKLTEQESNAIIIASYGTFSTGINIRNLHNVVFASPTKSRIRTLQSIGRGLRLGDNKEKATLYDIADDLRYKSYVNYTLKHYEERIKMYGEERFPFKIHNIKIGTR